MLLYFLLGLLSGLIISVLVVVVTLRYTPAVKRTISQLENLTDLKGEIIEPENEELADWVDNLPKDDKNRLS